MEFNTSRSVLNFEYFRVCSALENVHVSYAISQLCEVLQRSACLPVYEVRVPHIQIHAQVFHGSVIHDEKSFIRSFANPSNSVSV